jgi:predicted DNA-binding transcriptional regulator YafY
MDRFSALLLLQAHGKMTVRQLARRLEVSYRNAYRDLEALSAAGVPVLALRGASGGWQLDEEWRTRVPGLDDAELRAFLMAQPRVVGDGPLAAAAERALDKMMAAMPVSLRARAAFIRERLYVDVAGWRGVSENLAFLPPVHACRDRGLRFILEAQWRAHGAHRRSSAHREGHAWYLVANTPEGFRTFRLPNREGHVLDAPSSARGTSISPRIEILVREISREPAAYHVTPDERARPKSRAWRAGEAGRRRRP